MPGGNWASWTFPIGEQQSYPQNSTPSQDTKIYQTLQGKGPYLLNTWAHTPYRECIPCNRDCFCLCSRSEHLQGCDFSLMKTRFRIKPKVTDKLQNLSSIFLHPQGHLRQNHLSLSMSDEISPSYSASVAFQKFSEGLISIASPGLAQKWCHSY